MSKNFAWTLNVCLWLIVLGMLPNETIAEEYPSLGRGADPWIISFEGRYYWIRSDNRNHQIIISVSNSLFPQNETINNEQYQNIQPENDYRVPEGATLNVGYPLEYGTSFVIWKAPETGLNSKEIWAPELHRINDRWFIYFAASDGNNANHRTFVLKSKNRGKTPVDSYELYGPLYTGDDIQEKTNNRWAIDMTVFEYQRQLYAVWSGWEDVHDEQFLYIAPMSDPTTISAPRVKICDNDDYLWERVEENELSRGLMEGPEFLIRNNRIFLTYSAAASWLPTYKIGLLELVGTDPLDPNSWKKYPTPLFQSSPKYFGVGHASFISENENNSANKNCLISTQKNFSRKNEKIWMIFHAKLKREPGWLRACFAAPVSFDENDFPYFPKIP